jgi:hypothetical protein
MVRTEERASVLAMRQLVDDAWDRRLAPPRTRQPRRDGASARRARPRSRTGPPAPATRWWTGEGSASVSI